MNLNYEVGLVVFFIFTFANRQNTISVWWSGKW